MAMIITAPFMSFAVSEESSDAPETGGSVPAGETADLSGMTEGSAAADELLVLVEKGTKKRVIESITDDAGASLDTVATLGDGTKIAKVSFDDTGDAQAVADELLAEERVLAVQPNYIYKLGNDSEASADKELSSSDGTVINNNSGREHVVGGTWITQWYMGSDEPGAIRAFDAWELLSSDGVAVKVAVIDTGVKLDHPDLEKSIIADECVTFNNGTKSAFDYGDGSDDDNGHGTHVCGIIASEAEDEAERFGISGVSYNRAKLIVIDAAKPVTFELSTLDTVLAIDYAVKKGADIINMSIGALYRDYMMENAVNDAYDRGTLVVCASGNENSELAESPGDSAGAISVMAHDEKGNKASFSNYGYEKDVSAPGVGIVSTYVDKSGSGDGIVYTSLSGTSMASPVVAGLAALLKSEDSSLSPRELKNLIYTSSGNASFGSFGFGRIDAVNAVNNLNGDSSPQSIVLNRTAANMYTGECLYLEYAVYPGSASRYSDEVKFSSSNAAVAEVDENSGKIIAKSAGTADITAYRGDVSKTCSITVSNAQAERITGLPYYKDGYFSPTDQKIRYKDGDNEFEVMADSYEVQLAPYSGRIDITVQSNNAEAYIRVYDPDGRDLKVARTLSNNKTRVTSSFDPQSSGTYLIQIMGCPDGSEKVNKPYRVIVGGQKVPIPISSATVSGVSSRVFTGGNLTQNVSVSYGSAVLKNGTDYTLSYSNNINCGTGYVIITGRGLFTGSRSIPFSITPKRIDPDVSLSNTSYTWNNRVQTPQVSVKTGNSELGRDQYSVSVSGGRKNVGVYSVKVTLKGNYSGSKTLTYRILPKGTSVSKLKRARKALTVRWGRQAARMNGGHVNGYQIQLSTDSKFKSNLKTVTVKGYKNTSKKVTGLKAKKKYYVRIRTYKTVNGKKYYSGWSRTKTGKTK